MIHALHLSPRLIVARTLLRMALPSRSHLVLEPFEYSPHLRVLAQIAAPNYSFQQVPLRFAILNPTGGTCPQQLQQSTVKTYSFAPAAEKSSLAFPFG